MIDDPFHEFEHLPLRLKSYEQRLPQIVNGLSQFCLLAFGVLGLLLSEHQLPGLTTNNLPAGITLLAGVLLLACCLFLCFQIQQRFLRGFAMLDAVIAHPNLKELQESEPHYAKRLRLEIDVAKGIIDRQQTTFTYARVSLVAGISLVVAALALSAKPVEGNSRVEVSLKGPNVLVDGKEVPTTIELTVPLEAKIRPRLEKRD
jgi:hypothetical protein